MGGTLKLWYMSFADASKPEGPQQWLGACIVDANDAIEAIQEAWRQKCNPGGTVISLQIREDRYPPDTYINRLLTYDDLTVMQDEISKMYDIPKYEQGIVTHDEFEEYQRKRRMLYEHQGSKH